MQFRSERTPKDPIPRAVYPPLRHRQLCAFVPWSHRLALKQKRLVHSQVCAAELSTLVSLW